MSKSWDLNGNGIHIKSYGGNSAFTHHFLSKNDQKMVSTSHKLIISPTAGKASETKSSKSTHLMHNPPLCLHAVRQRQIPKQHHPAALQEARHFGLPSLQKQLEQLELQGGTQTAFVLAPASALQRFEVPIHQIAKFGVHTPISCADLCWKHSW